VSLPPECGEVGLKPYCYVLAFAILLEAYAHAGALVDDMPDLEPLQDMPIDEDVHYWTHRDDEEDKATVCAMISAEEDPYEAVKQHLYCGGAYMEEIID